MAEDKEKAPKKAGEEPTYGESCDAFLAKLEAAE